MKLITLQPSTRKLKKWMVKHPSFGTIHFGNTLYEDYTQHKDSKRRKSYIQRHKPNQDWTIKGIDTAAYWARWLLWNKPSLQQAIEHLNKKYKSITVYKK